MCRYSRYFVSIICIICAPHVQNASISDINLSSASLFKSMQPMPKIFPKITYSASSNSNTLVLIHAVFRHGDRTNDKSTSWPTNPYADKTYYPYGWGQLTNKGKVREYNLGKKMHERYIAFLGKTWTPDILEARSTAYNRTKMSLQLVLAGLYPPSGNQIFQTVLPWQPIPYNYVEAEEDYLLLGKTACPSYDQKFIEVNSTEEYLKELESYQFIFDYLSQHAGFQVKDYLDSYLLYFGLTTTLELGDALPDWTKSVYPTTLRDLAIKNYERTASTIELKRLLSGELLKKIVDDTKAKVLGTLNPPERKLFLYSGHETNIAYLLITLGVYEPHVPTYGSCVMVEIHNIDGLYGVKLYYEDYSGNTPRLLTIPGCVEFCPLYEFFTLVADKFPTADSC